MGSNSNVDKKIESGCSNKEQSQENLRFFIDYTWKDIHHSRLQNWTSITVITAFHLGVFKITEYLFNKKLLSFESKFVIFIFGSLFSLIGFLIIFKHQMQLYKRLEWIDNAERNLVISETERGWKNIYDLKERSNENNHNLIYRFLRKYFWAAGIMMGYFYILLMIIDVLCIYVMPSQ